MFDKRVSIVQQKLSFKIPTLNLLEIGDKYFKIINKTSWEPVMMENTFNPNTQEAKADESLIQYQPSL